MTTLTARRFDTGEAIRIQFLGKQVASIFPASVSSAELESLPFIAPGLFDIQLNGFKRKAARNCCLTSPVHLSAVQYNRT